MHIFSLEKRFNILLGSRYLKIDEKSWFGGFVPDGGCYEKIRFLAAPASSFSFINAAATPPRDHNNVNWDKDWLENIFQLSSLDPSWKLPEVATGNTEENVQTLLVNQIQYLSNIVRLHRTAALSISNAAEQQHSGIFLQVTLTKVQKVIGLSYGRKSGLGPINWEWATCRFGFISNFWQKICPFPPFNFLLLGAL